MKEKRLVKPLPLAYCYRPPLFGAENPSPSGRVPPQGHRPRAAAFEGAQSWQAVRCPGEGVFGGGGRIDVVVLDA